MKRKELFGYILDYFAQSMGVPETELNYDSHFGLLVAVVLSAQCTDKRVNLVTPALMQAYPTSQLMSEATEEDIFSYIKSVSYPNNKARHLVQLAKMLTERFGGKVPSTLEELTSLPGVGRKTANVILSVAFGKSALAVDTHVFRVSHRLGLVPKRCTTPYAVEMALKRYIPEDVIPVAHHWLLLHGRYVCVARRPKCDACGLRDVCPNKEKTIEKHS